MLKKCSKCKISLSVDNFTLNSRNKDGYQAYCRSCVREARLDWYRENPQKRRDNRNKHRKKYDTKNRGIKYNLTPEQLEELYVNQNRRCAWCKRHESEVGPQGLAIDHCHDTGAVRRLLCFNCNVVEGLLHVWPEGREALERLSLSHSTEM